MSKQLLKSLAAVLVKGFPVRIAETYSLEHLRNVTTTIRSKGPVPCNQNGRCANGLTCVKQAIFVVDPTVKPDETAGWRHGVAKVCLTHVINPETGENVLASVPAPAEEPEETVETPEVETQVVADKPETARGAIATEEDFVSWDQLAASYAAQNIDRLARQARSLKCENDILVRRLAELQERLIRDLDGEEPAALLDAEILAPPVEARETAAPSVESKSEAVAERAPAEAPAEQPAEAVGA